MHIFSFSPFGYEGALVSVEVDLRRGIPAVDVIGLADGAVRESRERMHSAICNSGFDFPMERVIISLSPADMKKEGAGFDLAIALAVLNAKNVKQKVYDEDILIMGELDLFGNIRPVRGIHAAVSTAVTGGIKKCIVPFFNGEEAREVREMKVFPAEKLTDAYRALSSDIVFTNDEHINKKSFVPEKSIDENGILFPQILRENDFIDIEKQEKLVRGLQIAAAGGHNLMAFGPPGCGKTLALRRFQSLLPLLTLEEAYPVTRIYSLAGILSSSEPLMRISPFRMPHQTATIEGLCGGGPHCRPGEISLAHNGVLFLDEASEFRTSVLQMLRVPLESGRITLSRAGRATVYPSSFQLLMATNPCPCGNYGSKSKICLCSAHSIEQFWRKFSGPLIDRIDMRIYVDICQKNETQECSNKRDTRKSSSELRKQISIAVARQRSRQKKKNANLHPEDMKKICKIKTSSERLLQNATRRYGFSPRAVDSCLKLARTIADMNDSGEIHDEDIEEAIFYRKTESVVEYGI